MLPKFQIELYKQLGIRQHTSFLIEKKDTVFQDSNRKSNMIINKIGDNRQIMMIKLVMDITRSKDVIYFGKKNQFKEYDIYVY